MFVTCMKMENANDLSDTPKYPLNISYMALLPAEDHVGSCYPRYAGKRVKK